LILKGFGWTNDEDLAIKGAGLPNTPLKAKMVDDRKLSVSTLGHPFF